MKGKKTGGRQKGSLNKATAEVKTIAREYGPAALARLAKLAGIIQGQKGASSEQAQVSAIKEILDRGYGKSSQPLANDPDNPLMPQDPQGAFQVTFVVPQTKK